LKNKILIGFSLLLMMVLTITICFADNPIVQTIYTADPAPLVYDGVCYVYTGHDADVIVNNFFTMNDWRCYSSTDMQNWTDLGSPLSYSAFGWAKGDCWAGQCVYRNGKFYYYVPMTQKTGGMAIGVAVSTSPAGPFSDALGVPLVYTGNDIDPTVFIDDDGQAYLYWGNPNLYYVKLNQDMISYSGNIVKVNLTTAGFGTRTGDSDRTTLYEEGPWFYKRNGLYYMIFAASGIPENICYSTSPGPTGPWTFKGVVMPTQGGSFTNHPGVVDYNGNSYFFYHNGALPGGGGFNRSVCVEQFKYNADGTIPTMNMATAGPPQLGKLNPYVATEAETICWESGVETESCSEGGMNVCNIENGDYIKVKGVDFGSGASSFEARIASATGGGNIELRLNSPTGILVGTCVVSGTGGWQNWVTKSCAVSGASGVHDLYLKFTGGSGSLFNFNWWKFSGSEIITPTPTPVTPTPTSTATVIPTLTPTPTPSGSYVRFRNVATGLYIDGMGSTANGSNACQWGSSDSNNQQWTLINSGSYVLLQNRATGLYLDGMGRTSDGSVCGQWGSSGSANQQWAQETLGSNVRFKNRATGLYLDGMGSTANGSDLCQWSNSGSANQQWRIE
jgi:arabinoxylan arabinofuranohydrolase